jgi:hypothetical protein
MQNTRIWLMLGMTALIACSEAADLSPDAGEGSNASDSGSPSGDGGSTTNTNDSGTISNSDAGAGAVALNEICGKGDNWVEIVNNTSGAVDVSNYAVCDTEKDGGGPKLSGAVAFPDNTILSPNSYLIVNGSSSDGGVAPCPDGGQSYCFQATWGISNKDGENIYLLAPGGSIAEQAAYPASTLNDGQTWGRLPNGTGAFTTTVATPGAANHD